VIFDTDVLIWALRGNEHAALAIDAATDRAISVVSLMELLQGARSKQEARQIRQSLRSLGFLVLPLSEAVGAGAVAIVERHALSDGVQVADALIAATALEVRLPLCTGNARHFRSIAALSRVEFHLEP
jgi:predicted nucleic acid-binding protein